MLSRALMLPLVIMLVACTSVTQHAESTYSTGGGVSYWDLSPKYKGIYGGISKIRCYDDALLCIRDNASRVEIYLLREGKTVSSLWLDGGLNCISQTTSAGLLAIGTTAGEESRGYVLDVPKWAVSQVVATGNEAKLTNVCVKNELAFYWLDSTGTVHITSQNEDKEDRYVLQEGAFAIAAHLGGQGKIYFGTTQGSVGIYSDGKWAELCQVEGVVTSLSVVDQDTLLAFTVGVGGTTKKAFRIATDGTVEWSRRVYSTEHAVSDAVYLQQSSREIVRIGKHGDVTGRYTLFDRNSTCFCTNGSNDSSDYPEIVAGYLNGRIRQHIVSKDPHEEDAEHFWPSSVWWTAPIRERSFVLIDMGTVCVVDNKGARTFFGDRIVNCSVPATGGAHLVGLCCREFECSLFVSKINTPDKIVGELSLPGEWAWLGPTTSAGDRTVLVLNQNHIHAKRLDLAADNLSLSDFEQEPIPVEGIVKKPFSVMDESAIAFVCEKEVVILERTDADKFAVSRVPVLHHEDQLALSTKTKSIFLKTDIGVLERSWDGKKFESHDPPPSPIRHLFCRTSGKPVAAGTDGRLYGLVGEKWELVDVKREAIYSPCQQGAPMLHILGGQPELLVLE